MERIPTRVLYARRVPGTRGALVETAARLAGVIGPRAPAPWRRRMLGFLDRNAYTTLAYAGDWLAAFARAPALAVRARNVVDLIDLAAAARELRRYPLVIVLHSAAGDDLGLLRRLRGPLQQRRGTLVVFFGNEYARLGEKIAFARAVAADVIASQLPPRAAAWLYQDCAPARLLHAPPALAPECFDGVAPPRVVDIGFRGDLYPASIGDDERNRLLCWAREHAPALGFSVDVEFRRLPAPQWCRFLRRCHGIVGAEAGTRFLVRDEAVEHEVQRVLAREPAIEGATLRERCYRAVPSVSGKAISSRHFEAIGAGTCQILLEGDYNGILEPDVHYLSVRHDWSNLDEVLRRFRDPHTRRDVTDAARRHVLAAHTYAHRVASVLSAASGAAPAAASNPPGGH